MTIDTRPADPGAAPSDRTRATVSSISNPLRILGLARIIAGGWFIAAGVTTLLQFDDLRFQAERLFNGDPGTTDAPIRSLLSLVTAALLVGIGLMLIVKGFGWMRRLPLPPEGPAAIERDEVIATLIRREAPAFGDGPTQPYWPLRRWLTFQLGDLTWWRRDVMGRGVRAFVRSCGFALVLGALYFALPYLTYNDLLGPFPTNFVIVLLFVTALWAALGLMLISTGGPRIESFEFRLPLPDGAGGALLPGQGVESRPALLNREPPGLGLTLGIVGVAVQCLMVSWWKLSYIGFPLMATSIVRHTGSIAGGILFLFVGNRIVAAASELLLSFRYESTLVFVEDTGEARVGHGAAVRTESCGLRGPRHVIAAVAGSDARATMHRLIATEVVA